MNICNFFHQTSFFTQYHPIISVLSKAFLIFCYIHKIIIHKNKSIFVRKKTFLSRVIQERCINLLEICHLFQQLFCYLFTFCFSLFGSIQCMHEVSISFSLILLVQKILSSLCNIFLLPDRMLK